VDVAATVIAAANVEVPWTTNGHNLRPLVELPDREWTHPAFMEQCQWQFGDYTSGEQDRPQFRGVPWWLFIRKGRYKYVQTLAKDEIEELYDLETDPQELHNLAQLEEHQTRVNEYRDLLLAELRRTDAKMIDHLPQPKRNAK
jgi:arylsulfatase A-like enzyme